ncbi:1625_t:CDS:2 [Paraglomus occultum]|uniref:Chromatin modification-related protein n=1 Tax=Paraglomus occultum TaxID=144539 RepID=A0A9N8VQ55_9GLOM|nr:1625_t:CDS:2 [Paraglomus occultum]
MTEVIDANEYLIEFLASIDNLPSEIKHHSFELKSKEDEIKELLRNISARERRLFALLDGIPLDSLSSSSSSENEYSSDSEYRRPRKRRMLFADENEEELVRKIKADYSRAEKLQDEKVTIAEKMVGLVERHVNRMDEDFEVLFPQYHLKDSVIAPEENLETDLGISMFDPLQELPTETEESHFAPQSSTAQHQLRQNRGGRRRAALESRRRNPRIPLVRYSSSVTSASTTPAPGRIDLRTSSPVIEENLTSDDAASKNGIVQPDGQVDPNEPKYCYCDRVSFGEMIACDGENCPYEWFHLSCLGLTGVPKGRWYCEVCDESGTGNAPRKRKRGRPIGSTNKSQTNLEVPNQDSSSISHNRSPNDAMTHSATKKLSRSSSRTSTPSESQSESVSDESDRSGEL